MPGFICSIHQYLFTLAVCLNSSISYISDTRIILMILYSVPHRSLRNISITELSWRNSSKYQSSPKCSSMLTQQWSRRKSPRTWIPQKAGTVLQLECCGGEAPFCASPPAATIATTLQARMTVAAVPTAERPPEHLSVLWALLSEGKGVFNT